MIEFDKFGIEERKTPESGDCYGEFVIEPLEHGFGVTLGLSLIHI